MSCLIPLWKVFPSINYEKYIANLVRNNDLDKIKELFGKASIDRQKIILVECSSSNDHSTLKWGYKTLLSTITITVEGNNYYINMDLYQLRVVIKYMTNILFHFGEDILCSIGCLCAIKFKYCHMIHMSYFHYDYAITLPYELNNIYLPINYGNDKRFTDNYIHQRDVPAALWYKREKYTRYSKIRALILISRVIGKRGELSANQEMTHVIFKLLG
jgi:hypothetical protein